MLDYIFVNGSIPCYDTEKLIKSNVGIKDGKIEYVGEGVPESKETIDASGMIVSPGFIDIHMHEENFKEEGEGYVISEMMLNMGVTTAVGGNCGIQYQSIAEFRRVIKELGGSPINYAMLAGYNQCRYELGIGRYETATPQQRAKIRELLEGELESGAFGISFGIEYDPGITYEELLEGARCLESPEYIVAAHYRSDCIGNIDSIRELIKLADEIQPKLQISHLSSCSAMGCMKESLNAINEAMEKNPRIDYDTYPYNAFSTTMGSTVFEDGCLEAWGKSYENILLTDEPYKNVYCTKEIFEEVREKYPGMLAVAFVMNEDEIREAISNNKGMIASDGIINNGNGHPRAAGTFPRVLGKYVREEKALTMIDALRKMTLRPAARLGLSAKGQIKEGCDADITVFNPDTVMDGATFMDLNIKPVGIEYVFINGAPAIKKGKEINNKLGRFLELSR